MARFVEHDERREGIIEHALDIFIDVGFERATFQKIADRARVTRTTLYQYFKDKKELFHYSIKHFLNSLAEDIKIENTITGAHLCAVEKLILILRAVLLRLEKNRKLLIVILNFLVQSDLSLYNLKYYLRRRTVRFKGVITSIIIDGIKSGELREIKTASVYEIIFSLLEAAILELAVLKRESVRSLLPNFELCIKLLAK